MTLLSGFIIPMKSDSPEIKLLFLYKDEESHLLIINMWALIGQTFVAQFQITSTKKKVLSAN